MAIAKRTILLALILLVGAVLRFSNLELKPLWMDEVITGLFSFGRNYNDVPLNQVLPATTFQQVFTLNTAASCGQIAATIATQSVHPPLFFCWMHHWLNWVDALPLSWIWKLRALPALFGVVAIAALYKLNRLAFSTRAGLIGAAIMAVSPFAVYLSQEARHYTLPMLLVILALCGLYQLLQDLYYQQLRPLIWLGWIAVNSLGFYVHYFFLLAFAAQAVTLLWLGRQLQQGIRDVEEPKSSLATGHWSFEDKGRMPNDKGHLPLPTPHSLLPLLPIALVCLTYLPWLPTLINHIKRPETDWVRVHATGVWKAIAPLFQIVSGWSLTTIALPVENQALGIAIFNGCLMALFAAWLVWRVGMGLAQLWQTPPTQVGTQMLGIFSLTVMVEFLTIAYVLGKDFTQVPRYNFIYFPGICALVGAGLSQPLPKSNHSSQQSHPRRLLPAFLTPFITQLNRQAVAFVLLVATFSSVLVISNQGFQKPYNPDQVAQTMLLDGQRPVLVVSAYDDFQDVALGLSFALQLAAQTGDQSGVTPPHFTLIAQPQGYGAVWNQLAQLPHPLPLPLNLWVVAPGLKRVGYPPQLLLGSGEGSRSQKCQLDPKHYYRIGIPYQLYRCP